MNIYSTRLLFIVDDNLSYANMLAAYLSQEISGVETKVYGTGEACLHEMHLNPFAIVLDYFLDTRFEQAWNGIHVLKKIVSEFPDSNVIVLSAQESLELALNCIKEGAIEYVVKNEKTLPAIQKIMLNLIDDDVEY